MSKRGVKGPDRDPKLESRWRKTLARWQRSGQTVRAFCAGKALSEPNFYAWRREIARREAEAIESAPKRTRKRKRQTAPTFLPVKVIEVGGDRSDAPIEVVLRTGEILRLRGPVDRASLAVVVSVLGGGESTGC